MRRPHCAVTLSLALLALSLLGCDQAIDGFSNQAVGAEPNGRMLRGEELHPRDLLSNPDYLAFCYGGYRGTTREEAPSIDQIKEDLRILSALGVKIVRTYNSQQFEFASNLLQAIEEMRKADEDFEMYVMLGAWIECRGAWSSDVDHESENLTNNRKEIDAAVKLANQYPETVKVIAVGNEAMVHWASNYFVRPGIILKWVNHLQKLKGDGKFSSNVWITSSDNYAAWGGAENSYHTPDLEALIRAVDYVSLHTYPFHDSYHTPKFWIAPKTDTDPSVVQTADAAIERAVSHAVGQFESTAKYLAKIGVNKPIHIGETGWASRDSSHFGEGGSRAADEYKAARFYDAIRRWTKRNGVACFYFEAFDEPWKDTADTNGSENHFGLINVRGEAKFVLWDEVNAGLFDGLTRDGQAITKTHDGDEAYIYGSVLPIPSADNLGSLAIATTNAERSPGELVKENRYVVLHDSYEPNETKSMTYPSELVKLNVWEGTCGMELEEKLVRVTAGTGDWWGCALELQGDGQGEDLSRFAEGRLHFEIRGSSKTPFEIGFQTGMFNQGTQVNCHVAFGSEGTYQLSEQWTQYSVPLMHFTNRKRGNLTDVTGLLFLKGGSDCDGKGIEVRNIYWSTE